jgi:2',3'-cyclic-nucleotide 2'-phosphodiesterase/3'-nucleotidase
MFIKKSRVFIFVLSLILLSFIINSLIPEEDRTIDAMSEKPIKPNTYYKQIDIISTNNFNSDIGDNINNSTTVIEHYISQNPAGTLLINTGDNYQSGFTLPASYNKPTLYLGNYLEYTANNKFNLSQSKFKEIIEKTDYQFLAASLYNKDTGKPVEYLKPYLIEEVNGIKVGLIGIFIPSIIEDNNLVTKDSIMLINQIVPQIRAEGADLVILIAHTLKEEKSKNDQKSQRLIEIAKQLQDVDGIISGGQQQAIATTIQEIPLIAGYQVGHLRFLINTETREVNRIIPNIYGVKTRVLNALLDNDA